MHELIFVPRQQLDDRCAFMSVKEKGESGRSAVPWLFAERLPLHAQLLNSRYNK